MSETGAHLGGIADAEEEHQRGRKHIFAVNGAPEFLDAVRVLFQDESYNVTTTNFVTETFEQIVSARPDLVLVDLAIYVQAGWDLLARLRSDLATCDIPVIVVSTDKTFLDEVQADPARYGGQRFLAKPFDIDDMLGAVRDLIGEA